MINRVRFFGAKQILLHTNHLIDHNSVLEAKISSAAPASYRDNILRYNDIIRDIARLKDVSLTDIGLAWERKVADTHEHGLLLDDGIHLSSAGHDFYVETAYPPILRAFSAILAESA
jgi:lysophospholipase L1-like esterase